MQIIELMIISIIFALFGVPFLVVMCSNECTSSNLSTIYLYIIFVTLVLSIYLLLCTGIIVFIYNLFNVMRYSVCN
jgi:hypothetical protein